MTDIVCDCGRNEKTLPVIAGFPFILSSPEGSRGCYANILITHCPKDRPDEVGSPQPQALKDWTGEALPTQPLD